MVAVNIDRGTVEATDFLSEVPENEWRLLLGARRSFVKTHIPYDCRELLRFVADAEQMYTALGFQDATDLLKRGLEIDPELVDWAVAGLRTLTPDEPVTLDSAVTIGKSLTERAQETVRRVEALGAHGGEREQATGPQGDNITLPQSEPRQRGSTSAAYLAARLKRDFPEVAERLAEGAFRSVRAAAVAAGIVKVPTLIQQAMRLAERMSAAERIAFGERFIPLLKAAEEEANQRG